MLHSYVPIRNSEDNITIASTALIIILMIQILLPIFNHHAVEFYPNHPHLADAQSHSHSYGNTHTHQMLEPTILLPKYEIALLAVATVLTAKSLPTGLIGLLLFWRWQTTKFNYKPAGILIPANTLEYDLLNEMTYQVRTHPPTTPLII